MLTFYNERGEGFGAQVEFTVKNAVNGERSVSGTIISNDRVLSEIDRGWKFELNGEFYNIVYAKPRDEGRNLSVSFDAVHQFFYDFGHSNCYTEFNGSHRFEVYIEAIFKDSGYRYQIEPSVRVNSIRKENFGNAKRLEMFKDIIKAAGLEFSVSGKVVLITKKIGSDLSTVVRKNFNMNELVIEKNINKFITYKKGFGAWKDENNHNAGRYEAEYESPLARLYGRIEGEPVTDERYKDTGKLLERLKFEVDNSYSISVQLDMEDLTRAGYQYTQPRAGDYIMAINETIGFREKIRIVSFESSYDVTGRLINHKVTCNDIGSVQKQISSENSIIRSVGQNKEYAESALAVATRALASADGKNTVYYGATKPKDEPIGTIRRGDILYLTAGEDTEMYIWNGSEWELKKLKLDTTELEKEFDKVKKAAEQASEESNRKSTEALKKAGTSEDLAKEAKQIGLDSVAKLEDFKRQATSAQTDLSNNLDALKQTVTSETNQASEYRRTTTETLSRMTGQMNGFATKSEVRQDMTGLTETFARLKTDTNNLISGAKSEITLAKTEFQRTADGLSAKMSAVERYVNQDGQRQESLQRYAREESARQATAVRETLSRDYVAKSTFTENAEGTRQRFEALKRENEVKLADYKQGIDGRIATITNQIAGKVNQTDFQRVKETSQLYERILGNTEQGLPDKISRLVMTNEIFQTEVGKYVTDDNNLIVNSMTMNKHTLIGNNNPKADISVNNGIFTIKAKGLTGYNWSGFSLPIYVKKIYQDETYTLGFKYRIREYPDSSFAFNVKNHGLNKILLSSDIGKNRPSLNEWQEFQKTFTVQEDFAFGEDANYPFYIYLAKNGWIEFKEPILVRGSKTGPYKPSQFDDAYKQTKEAKDLAERAQTRAIQVAEKAEEAKRTAEATRTQVTQLAGSYSIRNLNSAGDVLGAINLNPDGSIRINEGLISVGEKTYIKDGVIKKSMIGNAQIGTAHIGEIDASQARIINISAKNIVADGLTANIIRGGQLSSLNGKTDFDLQTGWIEMNDFGVGIKNRFQGRPLQYLTFGAGTINGVDGAYTALLSNRNGLQQMDSTSTGIQIWNGRSGDNIKTAITFYGQRMDFIQSGQAGLKSLSIDTINRQINEVEEIVLKGVSLSRILDNIYDNFRNLAAVPGNYSRGYYSRWR